MAITTTLTVAPAHPNRTTDPDNFRVDADTYLDWFIDTHLPEAADVITETNATQAEINASETAAALSEDNAYDSELVCLAAANFKGQWADKSGAATIPYSVEHNGYYYMLLDNLANVAAKTPGVDAEWGRIYAKPIVQRSARTTNEILDRDDHSVLVDITSGTFAQTVTAAATLGDGWFCYVRNSGTGVITIDPNLSETIDGASALILYPSQSILMQCTGSAFFTTGKRGDILKTTASATVADSSITRFPMPTGAPDINDCVFSVKKEVAYADVVGSTWNNHFSTTDYDQINSAYAVTLTPNAVSGRILLTLGSGSWAAGDVGKQVRNVSSGEVGTARIVSVSSGVATAYTVTSFTNTDAIASGDWVLESLDLSSNVEATAIGFYYVGKKALTDTRYMYISPDGTNLYIVQSSSDELARYTLSPAWNIASATQVGSGKSVNASNSQPYGIHFKSDGTKMFLTYQETVQEWTLSTAWDIETLAYVDSYSTATQTDSNIGSVRFNSDGTKMYVAEISGGEVWQYSLTSWDVSTASYASKTKAFTYISGGICFSSDGDKVYTVGSDETIYSHVLSTPWDISTAGSPVSVGSATAAGVTSSTDVFLSADDNTIFCVDSNNDDIYAFNVKKAAVNGTSAAVSTDTGQIATDVWTDIDSLAIQSETVQSGDAIYYALSFDGRATFYVCGTGQTTNRAIARNNSGTWQYNSNATYGSTTWTSATLNTGPGAIAQAVTVAANQMAKTAFEAGVAYFKSLLALTLDWAVAIASSGGASASTVNGMTITYDSPSQWQEVLTDAWEIYPAPYRGANYLVVEHPSSGGPSNIKVTIMAGA